MRNLHRCFLFALLGISLIAGCVKIHQSNLIQASVKGQLDVVEELIARGNNVNTTDYLDNCLISKNIPKNAKFGFYYSYGGITPLMAASMVGNAAIVRTLLKAGADTNAVSKGGGTALMLASYKGFVDIVEDLIAASANVNAVTYDGWSVLMSASSGGNPEVVKILLTAGATPNVTTESGETAVSVASYKGNPEIIKMLIAGGADVNATRGGLPAVAEASKYGQTDAVRALVESGADVNISHPQTGWNALLAASKSGYTDIVNILLTAGANANASSNIGIAHEGQYKGEQVTFVPQANNTSSLMQASAAGHIEIVKLLIAANADVNQTNAMGQTALSVAKTQEIKQLLIQAGAKE